MPLQLFSVLAVGGRLVIARPGGHTDPEYMATLMARSHVSYMDTGQ